MSDLASSWETAPMGLRLAVVVAEVAQLATLIGRAAQLQGPVEANRRR